jgi:hypothetical protein
MNKLVAVVEGPTERAFVQQHLSRHLTAYGLESRAILPGHHGNRGGVREWHVAKGDILRVLHTTHWCTTMFDYYGLPDSWPGRSSSKDLPYHLRAAHIEDALVSAIREEMGDRFDTRRFIPYIQLHEFEALLFADVEALASVAAPLNGARTSDMEAQFRAVLDVAGGDPEAINDNYATCPSRRIASIVPRFRKVHHGAIVVGRIGLDRLRERCRHFASWIERLESLR